MGGMNCKAGDPIHPTLARLLTSMPKKAAMMLGFMSRPGALATDCPETWSNAAGAHRTPRGRALVSRYPSHGYLMWHIKTRDGHRCVTCGAEGLTVVDHIISAGNGGANHPDNLQALCAACNSAKTGLVDVPLARMLFPARTVA